MEGPRPPSTQEWPNLVQFLNQNLRKDQPWAITDEYPTAVSQTNLHNVRIIKDHDQIISHAVFKPLIIKTPQLIFKVGAIGSVVTDERFRNQGLSREILKDCLQLAAEQHCDFAILWTQIFDFYRRLGFELAGSEMNFVFENEFNYHHEGLQYKADAKVAPEAIYRVYSQHTVNTVRTLEDIRKYLKIPQTKVYTAWDQQGQLAAYAIEGKGADLTDYVHEWGGGVRSLMGLFSWLRKTKGRPFTLITPRHSQNLIQEIRKVAPIEHRGYLGMLKVTDFEQLSAKIKRAFRNEGVADIVLEKRNNLYLFGCGQELVTIEQETDLIQLLLNPIDWSAVCGFSEITSGKLSKLLPLPLWIWGWDSI